MKTKRSERAPITRMKEAVTNNNRENSSFRLLLKPLTDKNATKNGTRDGNETIIACNRELHSFNIDHSDGGVINVSLSL